MVKQAGSSLVLIDLCCVNAGRSNAFPHDFLSHASSQCCYFMILELTPSINVMVYLKSPLIYSLPLFVLIE